MLLGALTTIDKLRNMLMFLPLDKMKKAIIKLMIKKHLLASCPTFSIREELDQLISRCVFGVLVVLLQGRAYHAACLVVTGYLRQ